MRYLLVLLLIQGVWAQASSTPTPSPTPDTSVRHASETDKPAMFGFMINARKAEMLGNPVWSVYYQCMTPGLLCAFLLPIYLHAARRGRSRSPA